MSDSVARRERRMQALALYGAVERSAIDRSTIESDNAK
jgi:hypothetical protein